MILADKIILLRKRKGWSQEELAEQLHVTRQSVSKWEGAQSVPDIPKIIQMSEIFGVTTDYLLKDEMESAIHPLSLNELINASSLVAAANAVRESIPAWLTSPWISSFPI